MVTPLAATFLILAVVTLAVARAGHGIASRRILEHGIEGENMRPKPHTVMLLGIGVALLFLTAAGVSAALAQA
jgi:hypothetical protein